MSSAGGDCDQSAPVPAPTSWPAVTCEPRDWTPNLDQSAVSRTMRARHHGRYLAAVTPAIANRDVHLPSATLALADEASTLLARFDAEIGADLAPFTAILLRSESASSSMIEHLSSGARQIALADLGGRHKRNATEIVGNVRAMTAAIALADDITAESILATHRALLARTAPAIAGKWRDQQVWIGGDSYGPHGASYIAPHADRVRAAVDDLIAFARRDDLPVLAQAAIAHAQFEAIHPFPDGNGRVGRALVHSMLKGKELTRRVTVPISAGLLNDPAAYFAALTAYRAGDVAAIVRRFAEASFAAVTNGRQLAAQINDIRADWAGRITARRDAVAWRLADLLLRQPVVDGALVARELAVAPTSARSALGHLASIGVLREFTGFNRNRMWESAQVLEALDAFAARAGRRSIN
ncbi:MAG: Fic family protein [Actinomycetia bacterium]|nr:Fic family protein [Actinomycetes bacterium]